PSTFDLYPAADAACMDIDIARGSRALSSTPSMPAASTKQSVQYHSPCRRSRNCNATAASGPSATMLLIAPLLDPRKGSDTLSSGDPRTGPFVRARRYLGFSLTQRMVSPDLWREGARPISGISGTQVFVGSRERSVTLEGSPRDSRRRRHVSTGRHCSLQQRRLECRRDATLAGP